MTSFEEKRARRLAFMKLLYEITDGRYLDEEPLDEMAQRLGWTLEEANDVFDYLENEGLVECPSLGGGVAITHPGVREVEQSLSQPDRGTSHFPPLNIVAIHGDVIGSQIQSGTTSSSQSMTWDSQRAAVDAFVAEFRRVLDDPSMPADQGPVARAYVQAVEAQLALPEPNDTIVREGLRSLRSIAENLAASGIFVGLVELAHHIHF